MSHASVTRNISVVSTRGGLNHLNSLNTSSHTRQHWRKKVSTICVCTFCVSVVPLQAVGSPHGLQCLHIGLDFMNPREGQAVCLSVTGKGDWTNYGFTLGGLFFFFPSWIPNFTVSDAAERDLESEWAEEDRTFGELFLWNQILFWWYTSMYLSRPVCAICYALWLHSAGHGD